MHAWHILTFTCSGFNRTYMNLAKEEQTLEDKLSVHVASKKGSN